MDTRRRPQLDRNELISRVRDLVDAERRRQAIPRGSPDYRRAEAEEEVQRKRVWELIERTDRVGGA